MGKQFKGCKEYVGLWWATWLEFAELPSTG